MVEKQLIRSQLRYKGHQPWTWSARIHQVLQSEGQEQAQALCCGRFLNCRSKVPSSGRKMPQRRGFLGSRLLCRLSWPGFKVSPHISYCSPLHTIRLLCWLAPPWFHCPNWPGPQTEARSRIMTALTGKASPSQSTLHVGPNTEVFSSCYFKSHFDQGQFDFTHFVPEQLSREITYLNCHVCCWLFFLPFR